MNEKEKDYSNQFRFSVYQEDVLLGEKVFDANQFNPFTRHSIDIREVLPKTITKLQKTLSKRNYDVIADVGRIDTTTPDSENKVYDLFQYHQKMISLYPKEWREDMRYSPNSITQQIEEKVIRGVECKMGFYINDKPIVERLFYVDGFNPVARWSVDLIDAIVEAADIIQNKIKRNDICNMWDDYDLINIRGLSINQIRELSPAKRGEMLRKLNRN
jgi:hypothetical protein